MTAVDSQEIGDDCNFPNRVKGFYAFCLFHGKGPFSVPHSFKKRLPSNPIIVQCYKSESSVLAPYIAQVLEARGPPEAAACLVHFSQLLMDPGVAFQQAREGASLLLLDVPAGTIVTINHTVCPKHRQAAY